MERTDLVNNGYLFQTKKEMQLAESEQKKIDFLESKIDYDRPEMVLRFYEKAITDKVFRGPVGIAYLKKMQNYLVERGIRTRDDIEPIPVLPYFGERVVFHNKQEKTDKKKQKTDAGELLRISIILNVALVVAVFAMYVIAFRANQPNIINYKRVLTNQYAQWEQDLTERESILKEKERALLNIKGTE